MVYEIDYQPVVVVTGDVDDGSTAYVLHRLMERQLSFEFIDRHSFARQFDVALITESGAITGTISIDRRLVPLESIRSAYIRYIPRSSDPQILRFTEVLESAPFLVCNRPSAAASNFSKLYQQQIIMSQGFAVPRTIVTSNATDALAFYERCGGRVVYKSASDCRSIVKRLSKREFSRFELLENCPTQFQEWIPGDDLRVHVIGESLFATEIESEAIDYRYSGRDGLARKMRAVELPQDLAKSCKDLAQVLNLSVAGIDLRRHLNGKFYCFEVNPAPAFAFFQQSTGQRMGDAVVDLLESA